MTAAPLDLAREATSAAPAAAAGPAGGLGGYLDQLPLNGRHALIFLVSSVGFFFDAIDLQFLGLAVPSISKEWGLTPGSIGWLFSLTAAGMLLGSYVFGTLSDHVGRRACFQVTIALFALGSGLCFFVGNIWQLGALRVLTGFGIGGFIPVDTAIMSEFMPTRRRGLMTGLWNLSLSVGYIVSAKIAASVIPGYGWRSLFLIGFAPAVLVLLVRRIVPESPRYLLTRGRREEARRFVSWISGDKALPPDLDAVFDHPLQPANPRLSVAELFSRGYRVRTAFSWSVWFFLMFCYLGLLPWLPTLLGQYRNVPMADVFGIMVALSASGVVGRVVVALLIDRVGRRALMIPFALAAMVAAFAFGRQTEATMRRAFLRQVGTPPGNYRDRFRQTGTTSISHAQETRP